MLELHHHPFSTYSRRVRIALIEKAIPHTLVTVDMTNRAHRQAPYLQLNPYGRVPALVEEGFVLFESTAILNYLEATHPQPALIPSDARGRALVDMHMKLCDLQLTRQAGAIIFPKRFLPKERWDLALFAQMKIEIEKHLAVLESQLFGQDYLVRNAFSLADVCYLPWLDYFSLLEIAPTPNIAAWAARLAGRPSAQQTKSAA